MIFIFSFLYINQTDPDGTMTWFVNQLLEAEKAGDKVQIVAHIPGSGSEALEGWAINYYNAVNRFEDTIVAQFFGHTHSEEHNMFYENPEDDTSRPTGYTLSAPSVTPNFAYNPAYRIYTIDGNYSGSTYVSTLNTVISLSIVQIYNNIIIIIHVSIKTITPYISANT